MNTAATTAPTMTYVPRKRLLTALLATTNIVAPPRMTHDNDVALSAIDSSHHTVTR
jgi:hypothetical protein